mmetsp:Transcript_40776/g.52487  ORF Transcript_40776/g.52487 Transcript_40776/m.52487 type:complete len:213 (-) Transcript_40776:73-711(-)
MQSPTEARYRILNSPNIKQNRNIRYNMNNNTVKSPKRKYKTQLSPMFHETWETVQSFFQEVKEAKHEIPENILISSDPIIYKKGTTGSNPTSNHIKNPARPALKKNNSKSQRSTPQISRRKVSFSDASPDVIPCTSDDSNYKDGAWWSEQDYENFKKFSLAVYEAHGTLHKLTTYDFFGGLNTSYLNEPSACRTPRSKVNTSSKGDGTWLKL